jgi:anti-sigma factor RsiW
MNHPSDLLMDLVDGSISPEDRGVVDAHLASCASCRQDVALAVAARDALRSLPAPDVPLGLGDAAIAEAEQRAREVAPAVAPLRGRGGRAEAPAWYRWAGAAAAAAAILMIVVVALPDVGVDDRSTAETADAGGEATTVAASGLEVQDVDYDTAAVQALALAYGAGDGRTVPPDAEYATGAVVPAADTRGFDEALDCVEGAIPDLEGSQPVRLIEARFEGTPAYLAVYLSGPGAGEPADTATVWVVARDTCEIVSTTRASL